MSREVEVSSNIQKYLDGRIINEKWLNANTKKIGDAIGRIAKNYLSVAFPLACVYASKAYKEQEYKNIYEYTSANFAMSRGMTSNLIKIAGIAFDEEGKLLPEYENFGFGQLRAISKLEDVERKEAIDSGEITSDMSVSEVEYVVKEKTEGIEDKKSKVCTIKGKGVVYEAKSLETLLISELTSALNMDDIAEAQKAISEGRVVVNYNITVTEVGEVVDISEKEEESNE